MSYKQTCFLSPAEREIINTLMPGNFQATMLEISAKNDETNYLYKLQNANTYITCEYEDAHTVGITSQSFPWAYDAIRFWKFVQGVSTGIPINQSNWVLEPEPMLLDVQDLSVYTADIEVQGAGGLDTGVEAVSTWYYIYLIGDSTDETNINMLLSISPISSGVTMPTGYDLAVRIGMVFNDAAGDFVAFQEKNCFNYREYWFITPPQILVDGAETDWTQVNAVMTLPDSTYVNVLGSFLRFALDANCVANVGPATGNEFFNLDYALAQYHYNNEYMPNIVGTSDIWYRVTSVGGETIDIYLNGFKYNTYIW